jgi:hypothetical protein
MPIDTVAMRRLVEEHHRYLLEIWGEYAGSGLPGFEHVPYLGHLPKLTHGPQLLVVGMNPSFEPTTLRKHWETVHANNSDLIRIGIQSLKWQSFLEHRNGNLQQAIRQLDVHSRSFYKRYYGPIAMLATDAGIKEDDWEHLDLLPIRATKQSYLLEHLNQLKRGPDANENVYKKMVDASIAMMVAIRPRAILVANAAASRILAERLNLRPQANGHRYDCRALPGVPFLLSSQLSGGTTSQYARERLLADLKNALIGGSGMS